nr:CDP-alcohol phosphatidyltransferase family protein [uncultured Brevundimonas sp.]
MLVIFRLLAAPALVALGLMAPQADVMAAALLSLAVLSDIFDGVIARRLQVVTPNLRRWDGRADVIFWLGAVVALGLMHPHLIRLTAPLVLTLVILEVFNHAVSFARFRREASPHHWLSKLFCLSLWALFVQLFIIGAAGPLLWLTFGLGVLSQVEAFAITLCLKTWRCDVASVFRMKA